MLNGAATHHISFNFLGNLFVLNVQCLHSLILSMFGTSRNLLDLLGVVGVVLVKAGDLTRFLIVDALHGRQHILCGHILIDAISM